MTNGLQYRIGNGPGGTVTVEVAERGSDEWHTLHAHNTVEAAADQIAALNETEAEINGPHPTADEFANVVKQILRVKPEGTRKNPR